MQLWRMINTCIYRLVKVMTHFNCNTLKNISQYGEQLMLGRYTYPHLYKILYKSLLFHGPKLERMTNWNCLISYYFMLCWSQIPLFFSAPSLLKFCEIFLHLALWMKTINYQYIIERSHAVLLYEAHSTLVTVWSKWYFREEIKLTCILGFCRVDLDNLHTRQSFNAKQPWMHFTKLIFFFCLSVEKLHKIIMLFFIIPNVMCWC